jgi:hypothetical protein
MTCRRWIVAVELALEAAVRFMLNKPSKTRPIAGLNFKIHKELGPPPPNLNLRLGFPGCLP